MNEAETRAEHIDPALAAAGWGVVEGSRIRREYPITLGRLEGAGKRGKPLTADYVLEYRNTKLAVVDADGEPEHDREQRGGGVDVEDAGEQLTISLAHSAPATLSEMVTGTAASANSFSKSSLNDDAPMTSSPRP